MRAALAGDAGGEEVVGQASVQEEGGAQVRSGDPLLPGRGGEEAGGEEASALDALQGALRQVLRGAQLVAGDAGGVGGAQAGVDGLREAVLQAAMAEARLL